MNSIEVDLVLSVFAVGMAVTSAIAVKWAAFASGPLRASVVLFILSMMSGMFAGVLVYYAIGGTPGLVAGFWAAAAFMSASVLIVFNGFLRELRQPPTGAAPPASGRSRESFVAAVVALVLANEFLMGWSFSLLSGALAPGFGPHGQQTVAVLSYAVTSPWFVFPMALEMVLTLRWLLDSFSTTMGRFLLLQPAIMVCSPPTLPGEAWVVGSTVAASALMVLVTVRLLTVLVRGEHLSGPVLGYTAGLFASLALMATGLFVWSVYATSSLFALSLLVQMVVFLRAVIDPRRFQVPAPSKEEPASPAGAPAKA